MATGNAGLVKWVTEFLELEAPMKKVDEMCTAVHYAQLLDSLYPGKVPLSKINFAAKNEYDLINNWKVIQGVFTAQGISKPIDVAKLVKGKTQDNLEFCQWFKTYFDAHHDGSPYPAREKRAALGKKGPAVAKPPAEKKGLKQPAAAATPTSKPTPSPAAPPKMVSKPAVIAKPIKPNNTSSSTATSTPASTPVKPKPSAPIPVKKTAPPTPSQPEPEPEPEQQQQQQQEQQQQQDQAQNEEKNSVSVEEYNNTLNLLKETIEGLEKERNYYFKRLQAVELYCQKDQNENPIAKRDVLAILYAEDEAKETKDETARRSSQELQQEQPQQQQQVQSQSELVLNDEGLIDQSNGDGELVSW